MVLFIMLYKVVLTFESANESYGVTIQMKATEQYFPVTFFIMYNMVVVFCLWTTEILWDNHSHKSY